MSDHIEKAGEPTKPVGADFFSYVKNNKFLFAALAYVLMLHMIECISLYFGNLNQTIGNPFTQGLWGWLFLFAICLMPGRVVSKILLTVLLTSQTAVTIPSVFLSLIFGLPLRAEILDIMAISSPNEVKEFCSAMIDWRVVICLVLGITAYACAVFCVWKSSIARSRYLFLLAILMIVPQVVNSIRFAASGEYDKIYTRNSIARFVDTFTFFKKNMSILNSMERNPILPENVLCKDKNILAVIVIGESANRYHQSLYGYPRKTNPALETKRNNVFVFSDVISGYANTVQSTSYMFTTADSLHRKDYRYTMFDVFKKAGFKTVLISNQSRWGEFDSPVSIITAHADVKIFVQERKHGAFDDELVDELKKQIPSTDTPTLIVLHLIGSHSGFKYRRPEEYKYFSSADRPASTINVDRWDDVDEYDNTIRFTDSVLGNVTEMLRQRNTPSFMLYCSDHGELPEQMKTNPRSSSSSCADFYEIPFVLYVNDAYKASYPEFMDNVRKNLNKPFMTDHFMYPVFSASQITFEGFPYQFDLFSPLFSPQTRRKLGDTSVYYKFRSNPYANGRKSAPAAGKE